jgi:hypothetical protein
MPADHGKAPAGGGPAGPEESFMKPVEQTPLEKDTRPPQTTAPLPFPGAPQKQHDEPLPGTGKPACRDEYPPDHLTATYWG